MGGRRGHLYNDTISIQWSPKSRSLLKDNQRDDNIPTDVLQQNELLEGYDHTCGEDGGVCASYGSRLLSISSGWSPTSIKNLYSWSLIASCQSPRDVILADKNMDKW